MNPFKNKRLEDFTISDCELYLKKYPYGEHCHEVKRHLRNLKRPIVKPNTENSRIERKEKHYTKTTEQHIEEISEEPKSKTGLSEKIVLWVIEIIVCISIYFIIVSYVINPVCEFIKELIGYNIRNNGALIYNIGRIIGLSIIFPIHEFFKSQRK